MNTRPGIRVLGSPGNPIAAVETGFHRLAAAIDRPRRSKTVTARIGP
jgi:hypothetical protein